MAETDLAKVHQAMTLNYVKGAEPCMKLCNRSYPLLIVRTA